MISAFNKCPNLAFDDFDGGEVLSCTRWTISVGVSVYLSRVKTGDRSVTECWLASRSIHILDFH